LPSHLAKTDNRNIKLASELLQRTADDGYLFMTRNTGIGFSIDETDIVDEDDLDIVLKLHSSCLGPELHQLHVRRILDVELCIIQTG